MPPTTRMKKLLIAEMKDADGTKVITVVDNPAYLNDVMEQVNIDLDGGAKTSTVKFYKRTQAWIAKRPEYEG